MLGQSTGALALFFPNLKKGEYPRNEKRPGPFVDTRVRALPKVRACACTCVCEDKAMKEKLFALILRAAGSIGHKRRYF